MYDTMTQVQRANADAGFHFFDADTLRWFHSRVGSVLYGGRYFITSEQNRTWTRTYPREYTIREALPGGRIETVGEFQQYETRSAALAGIMRLLREDASNGNQ